MCFAELITTRVLLRVVLLALIIVDDENNKILPLK